MTTTFIILCIIAFAIPVAFCIVYKRKIESMDTELGILKRRNATLEERFKNEEANHSADSTTEQAFLPGVEILQQFAQSHQIQLEKVDDYKDEFFDLYYFRYQGGNFHCFVGKHSDEVLLRYYSFFAVPYSQEAEIQVLRLCDAVTNNRKYAKLTYTIDKEKKNITLDIYYDMIGIPQLGLAHLLDTNFALVREVTEAADKLCKDLYGEQYAEAETTTEDEKTIDFHQTIKMISQNND